MNVPKFRAKLLMDYPFNTEMRPVTKKKGEWVTTEMEDNFWVSWYTQSMRLRNFFEWLDDYYKFLDPKTLGQATPMTNNEQAIYGGDIIELDQTMFGGKKYVGEVIFNTDPCLGILGWGLWTDHGYLQTDFLGSIKRIGTIYDKIKE